MSNCVSLKITSRSRLGRPEIWTVLRKIIKIVATRCQILRLKCTKIDFRWGSPGLAGIKGTYF